MSFGKKRYVASNYLHTYEHCYWGKVVGVGESVGTFRSGAFSEKKH